jgi:hypothetical protein
VLDASNSPDTQSASRVFVVQTMSAVPSHRHRLFRYERRGQRLLGRRFFVGRVLAHAAVAAALLVVSLLIGMAGYVRFEHLTWIDAFLNSAMLLGGMGPVDAPRTEVGKLFAGVYALFAGLVFLAAAGVAVTPIVHRTLHRFHLEDSA